MVIPIGVEGIMGTVAADGDDLLLNLELNFSPQTKK